MDDIILQKAVKNRRTIYPKMFNGQQVPENVIDKMLELANWAPNHKNTEPWRFKVYAGNAKKTC